MKAKRVDCLPSGEQWRYELKLDGYRAEAIKTSTGVRLISRNEKDLSSDYPEIVEDIRRLPMRQGVLDGEIVAVDASGKPFFQKLQHLGKPGHTSRPILYFAFDILNLEGKPLLSLPLLERKRPLERVLRNARSHVRFVPFLEGEPDRILTEICRNNLEGVVAKLASSAYQPDKRTGAWVKFKCGFAQDFVIGGYTRGQGNRSAFGALIVGYYESGRLRYASKVGTGFSNVQIREFLRLSQPLIQSRPPFEHIPLGQGTSWSYGLTAAELRSSVWLKPVLVCRVRFTEWTMGGHLRHPCFEGLRHQEAGKVTREGLAG